MSLGVTESVEQFRASQFCTLTLVGISGFTVGCAAIVSISDSCSFLALVIVSCAHAPVTSLLSFCWYRPFSSAMQGQEQNNLLAESLLLRVCQFRGQDLVVRSITVWSLFSESTPQRSLLFSVFQSNRFTQSIMIQSNSVSCQLRKHSQDTDWLSSHGNVVVISQFESYCPCFRHRQLSTKCQCCWAIWVLSICPTDITTGLYRFSPSMLHLLVLQCLTGFDCVHWHYTTIW